MAALPGGQPYGLGDRLSSQARYTADFNWPDMWAAVIVRSPHPKAQVVSVNTSEAMAVPGVERIFTAAEVPGRLFATGGHPLNILAPDKGAGQADKKLLTDRPRHQGDEVAVVVARDFRAAERGAGLIRIDYQVEESVGNVEAAVEIDAPAVDRDFIGNLFFNTVQESGMAVEDVFSRAFAVIETDFETQVMQHVPMETPAAAAWLDERQRLVVVSSTQVPHLLPRLIGRAIDWPESRIRVIKPQVGGGFGCKQDLILEALAAWLSLKLGGRPIKMIQSRAECFLGSRSRHAFKGRGRAATDLSGLLKALDLKVQVNIGAYAAHGHTIAAAAGAKLAALYPRASIRYQAESVLSNIAVAGAFRGFGFPQVTFLAESLVDEAAYACSRDPLSFRLANVAREFDCQTAEAAGRDPVGIYECLLKGKDLFQWDRRRAEAAQVRGAVRRGVGIACFCYTTGTYPFYPEAAGARFCLREDGRISLATGAVEIGQRSDEAVMLLAARVLNVEPERIEVVSGQDTDYSPYLAGAYSSRQTSVAAKAIAAAGEDFKKRLLSLAGRILNKSPGQLGIAAGVIIDLNNSSSALSLAELAEAAYYHPDLGEVITAEASLKMRQNKAVYGCSLVDLEVDLPLCLIRIKEVLNVHDSGSIVHQQGAEGQVFGGQMMGLAMALGEELVFDAKGRVRNSNLLDYKIPLASGVKLSCAFVEKTSAGIDFEPRSLGEAPSIPVAAAVGNALRAATGLRLTRLPFSPPNLFPHLARIGFGY